MLVYLLIFVNKFGKTIYNATNEWLVSMLNVLRCHVLSEFESKEIPFAFIFLIWIFFSLNFLHDLQVNIWKQCFKPTAINMATLQITEDNFNVAMIF